MSGSRHAFFHDFLQVIFVVCCCNPWPLIAFMVKNVDSRVYVLTQKDITCTSGFKVEKNCCSHRRGQRLLLSFVCNSTISISRAARLEGQSCVIAGMKEDTFTWKGFSIKLKISLCSFTSLNLDSDSPHCSSKMSTNPLWLKCCCRDGSFVVTRVSGSEWNLSDIQAVILFWDALIAFSMLLGCSSLPWSCKFRARSWQVKSVRGASCMIQCESSGSCFPFPV